MPLRPLRVLVVDDDADGAELLALLLRQSGCDARFACTAEEAGAAEGFAPDVLILDPELPGIDGYETARRLRGAPGRPVLVAVTGDATLEARSRAEGFDHHLPKPLAPEALIDLLRPYAAGRSRSGPASTPSRTPGLRFVPSGRAGPPVPFRWPLLASTRSPQPPSE